MWTQESSKWLKSSNITLLIRGDVYRNLACERYIAISGVWKRPLGLNLVIVLNQYPAILLRSQSPHVPPLRHPVRSSCLLH